MNKTPAPLTAPTSPHVAALAQPPPTTASQPLLLPEIIKPIAFQNRQPFHFQSLTDMNQ